MNNKRKMKKKIRAALGRVSNGRSWEEAHWQTPIRLGNQVNEWSDKGRSQIYGERTRTAN
jgi:hypothetical protein